MTYEIVRMPQGETQIREFLENIGDFMAAMYPPEEEAVHGPLRFIMDHFLYLWDNGGLFFLLRKNDNGEIIAVAIISQYRDLWSNRPRVEIQRFAISDTLDEQKEQKDMVDYLKGVASLLKFDQIYYVRHYADGSMFKELVWNDKE